MQNGVTPLLIIGLDSGEPEFIQTGIRNGHFKNLASILNQGTSGTLSGPDMISVHGVWTTLFSGVSLHQHGCYHQHRLEPGTYKLNRMDARNVHVSPFWAQYVGKEQQTLIVDVPHVDLVPGLNGVQIADWGSHNSMKEPSYFPPASRAELEAISGLPMRSDERQYRRNKDAVIFKELLKRVEAKGRFCRHFIQSRKSDLSVLIFTDTHAASHRFRKYLHTEDELKDAMMLIYEAVDHQIGLLLESFSQPVNVFVVSNSGIKEGYPIWKLIDPFLTSLGYQTKSTSAIAYERILPEGFRMAWDQYIPSNWRARVQSKRFGMGIDWSKTKAFAMPGYYTGYIRINLKGREPLGIVSSGNEYDSLLDQIERDFRLLVDQETNEPVVEKIHRPASIYGGGPPRLLPDLLISWRPCPRLSRHLVHPKTVLVRKKYGMPRGNYHSPTGFVAAAGPDIARKGDAGEFSPVHFASLFQWLLKKEIGEKVDVDPRVATFLN